MVRLQDFLCVMASLAQMEPELIKERTQAGLAADWLPVMTHPFLECPAQVR